jgi:hypothetical protein
MLTIISWYGTSYLLRRYFTVETASLHNPRIVLSIIGRQVQFVQTIGVGSERGSLHGKPFVILFWWSLYWTPHVLCRAEKTSLGRSVFCRCHGAGAPTRLQSPRRKGCIATQRLHSGPQTDMSGTVERTLRRHCPLYVPHTNKKKPRVHLGDPDSWFVIGVSWVRCSTHSDFGFSYICFSVSMQLLWE